MLDHEVESELVQLRARIAQFEQRENLHEKALRDQAARLEQSLQDLRERAEQLALSEDALRKQTRIFQAILRSISAGVVVAQETGKFLLFNPAAERMLGMGPTDVAVADWSKHYGVHLPDQVTPHPPEQLPLARAIRGEEVDDAETFIRNPRRPEGIFLSVTARPLRDEVGAVRGGLAFFRDITEQKRAAARLSAQYAVTRTLAEAASLGEATPRILQAICESTGWELGALWKVDRQATELRCVDVWHVPKGDFAAFVAETKNRPMSPGIGVPGRVWSLQAPIWVPDIAGDSNFPRADSAAACSLRGVFAFPILFGNDVLGVLEFFSREIRPPDDDLLSMVGALGRQIGQFVARRRAEADLRRSRERFELAVQGTGDAIWDWDLETNEIYFSPRWKKMLGYEDQEVLNSFEDWEKLVHPDDLARARATIQAYFSGATPTYELEHRLRHKDGTYRWILARGVALRDAQNKPYRMAGSHTDITERRLADVRLQDSEALYHSLVETLPLNVFRKDLQGRFTFGNQPFRQTVGRTLAELIGKTDFDFYPSELAEKYRQDDRRVIERGAPVDEVEEHQQPDGKKIYVQVIKTPVYDSQGAVVGTQAIFWDVTDRKQAEETMQRAKDAAESANRAKGVFLANMSHEIRTPMNAIIGMTELVLETELSIEQREYLDLVKKSAESLLGVINDVLDFSKVEAGKLDLDATPFALRDQLGDSLNTLAPRAYQKGLELACHVAPDVPDDLVGDALRLNQILVNLVGNALKFTERGEVVVDVETTSRTEREAWLHFAVSDTGIGVAADKLEFIFDPFAQADGSTTRRYGGTGLGLAIAQRLALMLGGRIWVESELDKGSTFHFTARFEVRPGPKAQPIPGDVATIHGMPVLVVDDNATNRRILEETLTHWQMKPTLAAGGSQALAALTHAAQSGEPFPLVLIDVHMPEMDGYMLAEQIKARPDLAGATLMMLTSGGQPGDSLRRRDLGVSVYLTKPVKQADLWRAIMQALGMPIAEDEQLGQATPPQPTLTQRLRILLAEDNLVNQKLALRLLLRRGHHVVVANNGREALASLARQSFDVVLMDVQMPEMDGYEATAAIRRQEQHSGGHLPIIAMTAYAMKGDRERCLAAGMDRYVSKPIRAKELFENVEGFAQAQPPAALAEPRPAAENGVVFHEAEALARVGDDPGLLSELAGLFLQECPRLLENVHNAVTAGNADQIRNAAHALKGSVDALAAHAAVEAAYRLEMIGRNGNLAGAHEAWDLLEKEINRLTPVLAELALQGDSDHGDHTGGG